MEFEKSPISHRDWVDILQKFSKMELTLQKYEKLIKSKHVSRERWNAEEVSDKGKKSAEETLVDFEDFFKSYVYIGRKQFIYLTGSSSEDYYNYYINYTPLTFGCYAAVQYIIKKKIPTIDKKIIKLNKSLESHILVALLISIYETYELDLDNKTLRLYKNKTFKSFLEKIENINNIGLIGLLDASVNINEIDIQKLELNISIHFKKMFAYLDICWEEIGFIRKFIDYSKDSSITSDEDNQTKSTVDSIDNWIKYTENQSNQPYQLTDDKFLHITIESTKKQFYKYGFRFYILPPEIKICKDIERDFSSKSPIVMSEKGIAFINNNTETIYEYIIYNLSNNKYTSQAIIDYNVAITLSCTLISFDKELFNVIRAFFLLKNNKKKYLYHQQQNVNIINFFDKKFKDNELISTYIVYFLDFRGRVYMRNSFSLTANKILRYIVTYENLNKRPINKNKYYDIFKKKLHMLEMLSFQFRTQIKNHNEEKKCILLVGILNLGKLFKKQLLINDKYKITLDEFLIFGFNIINKLDFENKESLTSQITSMCNTYNINSADDICIITTTINKLLDFIKNKKSFCIILDSTASGIFHINTWLKLNKEFWPCINLTNEMAWYDTYTWIFNMLWNMWTNPQKNIYRKYFTRKKYKMIIMTYLYNATDYTLQNYFFVDLKPEEIVSIRPVFKEWLSLLKSFWKDKFDLPFEKFHEHKKFKNNLYSYELFGNKYDFIYYKITMEEYVYTTRGKQIYLTSNRYTLKEEEKLTELLCEYSKQIKKTYKIINKYIKMSEPLKLIKKHYTYEEILDYLTGIKNLKAIDELETLKINIAQKKTNKTNQTIDDYIVDEKKTHTAFPANVVHSTDAIFLAWVVNECLKKDISVHTIHDEFIINVRDYFDFIEICNWVHSKIYKEVNNEDCEPINSLFIIL